MTIKLTWYGHGTWGITAGEHKILLDPFFNDNPASPIKADEAEADYILVSHGHFDHVGDAATVANRTKAPVVTNYEIAEWLSAKHNVENTVGMNIGGNVVLPFGKVKMTMAYHSSQLPDGSYGGFPGGFLLEIEEKRMYFACDTALFSDMKLYAEGGLDLAVLPIGDFYTMGPEDSVLATQLISPQKVIPAHYNTAPPIEQDASLWAAQIRAATSAEPVVMTPGETVEI